MSEDVIESSSWTCPQCPVGGQCAPGDEAVALAVHMLIHAEPER